MYQQKCENCNTPVFRPDCHFVMSCPACVLRDKQAAEARVETFNYYMEGAGLVSYIPNPYVFQFTQK